MGGATQKGMFRKQERQGSFKTHLKTKTWRNRGDLFVVHLARLSPFYEVEDVVEHVDQYIKVGTDLFPPESTATNGHPTAG